MPENQPAIEVKGLSFYYLTPCKTPLIKGLPLRRITFEQKTALADINVSVRKGQITALMGKNGSGKTTLIKVVTGARFPQKGTVRVFGENPSRVKSRIGLCMGSTLVYHRLTGRENLEYFGRLYNVERLDSRIREFAAWLGLEKKMDQIVESYSFGMKAKLALARAMIHSPELLVLDEPTLGMDYGVALQIREFVRSLNCTVLLTTHYMEEAESLANDILIIDDGRIIAQGPKKDVLARYDAGTLADAFSRATHQDHVEHSA